MRNYAGVLTRLLLFLGTVDELLDRRFQAISGVHARAQDDSFAPQVVAVGNYMNYKDLQRVNVVIVQAEGVFVCDEAFARGRLQARLLTFCILVVLVPLQELDLLNFLQRNKVAHHVGFGFAEHDLSSVIHETVVAPLNSQRAVHLFLD